MSKRLRLQLYTAILIPVRFLSALWVIIRNRKLLLLSSVPVAIGMIAFTFFVGMTVSYRDEATRALISFEWAWLQTLATWLVAALGIILSALLSLLVMNVLGSFFIESFIEEALRLHGVILPKAQTWGAAVRTLLRSIIDSLQLAICIGVCTLLLFLIGMLPPLSFVSPLLAAFLGGGNLIDLPLTLLEVPFKQRWKIAFTHWLEVLVLGAIFLCLLPLPFGAVLFLPVAYYVAVEKLVDWKNKEEEK